MNLRHLLTLLGILFFAIFITAKNGLLVNEKISFILSSDYLFYMSVFFIFMGYYLSITDKKTKDSVSGDSTPGLGKKKNLLSGKQHNDDSGGFDGGGGGD